MRRILGCFFLAVALGVACLYTWRLGWPALRGEAGPCTVTVTCPGGPAPAVYSYDLVGAGFCRTIHIFYDPAYPGDNYGIFQNLPPGSTGCWKTAGREAGCRFLWRLLPLRFGRITPGPLLWPGRFCARCAKRCMHFCNIIRLRRLSFHGIMTLYRGGMSTPRASDRPVSLKRRNTKIRRTRGAAVWRPVAMWCRHPWATTRCMARMPLHRSQNVWQV